MRKNKITQDQNKIQIKKIFAQTLRLQQMWQFQLGYQGKYKNLVSRYNTSAMKYVIMTSCIENIQSMYFHLSNHTFYGNHCKRTPNVSISTCRQLLTLKWLPKLRNDSRKLILPNSYFGVLLIYFFGT
jgi:hypothetical protein